MTMVGGMENTASVVVGLLDPKWRVQQVSSGVVGLLGFEPSECTGIDALEAVHPDDSATLMVCLGRALHSQRLERTEVRLWHKSHHWAAMSVLLAALHPDDPYPLGFLITAAEQSPAQDLEDRVASLELRLHHIANEVQAAGVGPWDPAAQRGTSTRAKELSVRQREILERLASGQRVATIARDLEVSPSTVRNHLSQIFRKLGVRSQAELLEALQAPHDSE